MARSPNMSGSRRLLARVRDTMAGAGTAQERLDRIATTIAADLVAEAAELLLDQARLAEGEPVRDAAAFGRRLAKVMERSLAAG